jgi:6-phosphogluconate dehydrogenase
MSATPHTPPSTNCLGVVGLGVMGSNLARNAAEKGLSVVAYERDPTLRARFASGELADRITVVADLAQLAAKLPRPRAVLVMVTAGNAVDQVVEALAPHLAAGDAIADGGNSHFEDTRRRTAALAARGLHFVGTGVSGGEEGARRGPCLMPGGSPEGWAAFRGVLEAIAARTVDGPCVAHMGPDGAGHFVKMVHNGIEYGVMQLLAEAYDLMKRVVGAGPDELAGTFACWNEGPLESFLVEITARILAQRDADGAPLVEAVLDRAEQKGTGRWTVAAALDVGIPVPTLAAGLDARALSSRLDLRRRIAARTRHVKPGGEYEIDDRAIEAALVVAHLCCHAQGFDLMAAHSHEKGWNLPLARIATIWQGGCIVRAELLRLAQHAFESRPKLAHLFEDEGVLALVERHHAALRRVVAAAVQHGVPAPALSASLTYLDALRSERLSTNLVQAQRDAFGAHGYRRVDDPDGPVRHSAWLAAR